MEKTYTVEVNEAGERLDKWLCKKLSKHSRKQIKALLDDGRVKINRKRVLIAGWELEEHDFVEVKFPPNFQERITEIQAAEADEQPSRPAGEKRRAIREKSNIFESLERHLDRKKTPPAETHSGVQERIKKPNLGKLKVYHHDRDLLVVEKPAGILSVPEKGKEEMRDNLLSEVRSYLKRKHKDSKGSYVYPLHRLDVETSGVMVFALSNVGRMLDVQFKNHTIRREYVALVSGRMERESGVIKRALEKGRFGHGRNVRTTKSDKGKQAITEYRVGERYNNATLVNIRVRTGRTHQIRVHLSSEGHPVIGDRKYSEAPSAIRFHRQALHAKSIGFKHPKSGNKMFFRSPMPDDMKNLIDQLRGA